MFVCFMGLQRRVAWRFTVLTQEITNMGHERLPHNVKKGIYSKSALVFSRTEQWAFFPVLIHSQSLLFSLCGG